MGRVVRRGVITIGVAWILTSMAAAPSLGTEPEPERPAPGAWTGSEDFRSGDKDMGRIFFDRSGDDSIEMRAVDMSLERVIERLAGTENLAVYFFCADPAQRQEAVNKRLVATSFPELLLDVIDDDDGYTFTFFDELGDPTTEVSKAMAIHAIAPRCGRGELPLRIFRPLRKPHPVLSRPVDETSLQELADVLATEGPEARREALRQLVRKDDKDVLRLLEQGLHDHDPDVVREAARSLQTIVRAGGSSDDYVDLLYRVLEERPYFELALVLVTLDKDRAWPLIDAMARSEDETVRGVAVKAVVVANDERGIDFLSEMVSSARLGTAQQAALAIGRIGGEKAAAALAKLLEMEDPSRVAIVAKSISLLSDRHEDLAFEKLVAKIRQPDAPPEILNALASQGYVDPMAAVVSDPKVDQDVKLAIVSAIAEFGTGQCMPALQAAMEDPSPQVRTEAARAMAAVEAGEGIPHLIAASADRDPAVRVQAAKSLGALGYDLRTMQALEQMFDDRDAAVRNEAMEAIVRWGEPRREVVEVLRRAAKEHNGTVGSRADEVLRFWGYQ